MTTTHAPAARQAGHPGRPIVPGAPSVPQVNLLPPEIRASRSLARVKRFLVLLIVLVLVLAGGGYYWAMTEVDAANDELAAQEAETTRLLNAQKEFAEVPQVLGALERARTARILGTSTEVLWAPFLRQLMTTKPAPVSFELVTFSGATPTTANSLSSNPLAAASIGTVAFQGRSPVLVDTAAWIESLESIPGFVDAYVTSMEISEEEVAGQPLAFYAVSGTVSVTSETLAGRFLESAGDDTDDEEADE